MKFNLSDFLQLDTKELLAVNGGFNCNGSSNTTVYPNTYYPSGSSYSNGGGGGSREDKKNSNQPVKTVVTSTGIWDIYEDGSGVWTDNYGEKHAFGNVDHIKDDSDYSNNTDYNNNFTAISGGGSCSTSSSNNPNGQGYSITSFNSGSDEASSGGGTCSNGNHNYWTEDSCYIPAVGGSCGGTCSDDSTFNDEELIKTSGLFGQITDGSYADELTMQYYKNGNIEIGPFYCETPEIAKMHDSEMNGGLLFSKEGCLMTCTAKLISEKSGKIVYLRDINNKVDKDSNGELSFDEIYDGLKLYLGNEYDIEGHWYEGSISKEKFETAASKEDTYVLARAYGDFDDDGKNENHWIVLEGYTTDSEGRMIFSYDGSSDNDALKNRVYVFGDPKANNEFKIDKIETFTFTKK